MYTQLSMGKCDPSVRSHLHVSKVKTGGGDGEADTRNDARLMSAIGVGEQGLRLQPRWKASTL